MFGSTVVTKLGFDATSGLATSIVSSEKKSLLTGVLSHVTSLLTSDTVVTGMGRTLGEVGTHYAAMQLTRKQLAGNFAFNPFKKDE